METRYIARLLITCTKKKGKSEVGEAAGREIVELRKEGRVDHRGVVVDMMEEAIGRSIGA